MNTLQQFFLYIYEYWNKESHVNTTTVPLRGHLEGFATDWAGPQVSLDEVETDAKPTL